MPFTFSHPAIIIPLSKTRHRFSLTGLVAGSVVPDFEFFFQNKLDENVGHHWYGFFLFDLPVAVMLCFIFHNIVRNTFICYMPRWYKLRFNNAIGFNWNEYASNNKIKLLIAISIGVCSHLTWDAFTHFDGAFVLMIPALHRSITLFHFLVPVYSLMQVGSSIWGLWSIQKYIASMKVETSQVEVVENNFVYWAWVAAGGLLIILLRCLIIPRFINPWDVCFAVMGSMLCSWVIVSIGFDRIRKVKWQQQ